MQLANWQQQLMNMAHGSSTQDVAPCVNKTSHIEQRLSAYQNNYTGGLINTLKVAYPQVFSFVSKKAGGNFFIQLANDYIKHYPMTHNTHQQYGAFLSQHINLLTKHINAFENVPYLADTAKVDWAMFLSYYSAKRSGFDFNGFGQLTANAQSNVTLKLAEDVFLIHSNWSLLTLYQFYQNNVDDFQLEQTPTTQTFIVHRPKLKPKMDLLSSDQAHMLHAIIQGNNIANLPTTSHELLPQFISNGWVCEYHSQ